MPRRIKTRSVKSIRGWASKSDQLARAFAPDNLGARTSEVLTRSSLLGQAATWLAVGAAFKVVADLFGSFGPYGLILVSDIVWLAGFATGAHAFFRVARKAGGDLRNVGGMGSVIRRRDSSLLVAARLLAFSSVLILIARAISLVVSPTNETIQLAYEWLLLLRALPYMAAGLLAMVAFQPSPRSAPTRN